MFFGPNRRTLGGHSAALHAALSVDLLFCLAFGATRTSEESRTDWDSEPAQTKRMSMRNAEFQVTEDNSRY